MTPGESSPTTESPPVACHATIDVRRCGTHAVTVLSCDGCGKTAEMPGWLSAEELITRCEDHDAR